MIADTLFTGVCRGWPAAAGPARGRDRESLDEMLNVTGEIAALVLAVLLGVFVGWMVWARGLPAGRARRGPKHAAPRRFAAPTSYGTDLSTGDVRVLPRDGKRREPAHADGRRVEPE